MFPILKVNFTLCIAGPTKSGKSWFCVRLLNNAKQMFDKTFAKIVWCLGDANAQPNHLTNPVVEFRIGLPEDGFSNDSGDCHLYILDDSMFESQNRNVANLFTRGCHHQNISVIYITQNLFHQSRYARDISLNFSHICLMNNPRDRSQIMHLARQLYPESPRELVRVYKECTQLPFSYLFIDLTQNTPNQFRFRCNIFNPHYSTVFCTTPKTSNDNEDNNNNNDGDNIDFSENNSFLIKNEMCPTGSTYSIRISRRQL